MIRLGHIIKKRRSREEEEEEEEETLGAYLVGNDVKEAGSPLPPGGVGLADEVLLSVAGHLGGRPRDHEVARYSPPVALAELLQAQKEHPVLVLSPRNACPQSPHEILANEKTMEQ